MKTLSSGLESVKIGGVFNVSSVSFVTASLVSSKWKDFGCPFFNFASSGATVRVKLRTNRQYQSWKLRTERSSVMFVGDMKPWFALVFFVAPSRFPGSRESLKYSIESVKKKHISTVKVRPALFINLKTVSAYSILWDGVSKKIPGRHVDILQCTDTSQ